VSKASTVQHSHLIDLADGWTSWRTVCLRGAGFPAAMLQILAAPDAVAAIHRYLDGEAAFKDARRQALAACGRLRDEAVGDAVRVLRRAARQIAKGNTPAVPSDFAEMKPLLDSLTRARDEMIEARSEAERYFADALSRISDALREVGADPRFREAVAWQNRSALHRGIDVWLRMPAANRNHQARKDERLVALYLQRYCAKNETIGFFGPIGWSVWSDDGPALMQRPGPHLVAERKVHFEYRAINALAEALSKRADLRKWLKPRLNARVRIEGNDLVLPVEKRKSLPPDVMRVLAACSGESAALDIAAALVADPDCRFRTQDEVHHILDQAARGRVVSWAIDVPVGPGPEHALRKILESVGDPVLRAQVMEPLDELETARDAVAQAAGDAHALDAALGKLEMVFTRHTAQEAFQNPGEVYAGRGLVYEDCLRQTEVEIGPGIRGQIAPPLALILQSARWFSHTIAARFDAALNRLYTDLKARFAPQPVPASAVEVLFNPKNPLVPGIVQDVVKDLTARWASILRFEPGARRLHLSADELRSRMSSAFAAPCPGWPSARHHSADILIASDGPGSVEQGRCLCVLGEVHVNDTMLTRPLFLQLHPRPEEFSEAYKRDVEQPRIFLVTSRAYRGHRKLWDPFFPGDFQLAWDDSPPWRPNDHVLRLADLIVENTADGLVVRTRDNGVRFPAAVYFERLLWGESFTSFKLLPPMNHTPRITIDNLVIHREAWRFLCRDLAFIQEKAEIDRFIGTRRWARDHRLPRFVFARVPQEYKPLYVDLESPASVDVIMRLARQALEVAGDGAELALSEMLPNPAQTWLTDAEGETYTAELRIVAVDPQSWRKP
jgi:hypothetical protein